jgi:hypothetical protein
MKVHENRILFLKEFTSQLIVNSAPPEISKPKEKLIIGETEKKEEEKKTQEIETGEFQKSIIELLPVPKPQPVRNLPRIPVPNKQQIQTTKIIAKPIRLINIPPRNIRQKPRYEIKPVLGQGYKPSVMSQSSPQIHPPLSIQPSPTAMPSYFSLDKLDFLIKDPRVTVIECPGPGKFILARASGTTSVTRISLSQEEIAAMIEKFSRESKIPVISGLFKAAVGNLVITAVISDVVGSRFMITKITPHFILEQQGNF